MFEAIPDANSNDRSVQKAQSTANGSKVGKTWVALAVFVFLLLLRGQS